MASMTWVKCKCCGKDFQARTADVKRGWGKFCNKSCKASKQEARTGQMGDYLRRKNQQENYGGGNFIIGASEDFK